MKKLWVILILCAVAFVNAGYLVSKAYELKNQTQTAQFDSFCDFNKSFACSPVLLSPYAQFFGYPFPVVAFIVYPILALIAILGITNKLKKAYPTLAVMSIMGASLNGYYIYQEVVNIGSLCPLCLLCTGIIITIFILSIIGARESCKKLA